MSDINNKIKQLAKTVSKIPTGLEEYEVSKKRGNINKMDLSSEVEPENESLTENYTHDEIVPGDFIVDINGNLYWTIADGKHAIVINANDIDTIIAGNYNVDENYLTNIKNIDIFYKTNSDFIKLKEIIN